MTNMNTPYQSILKSNTINQSSTCNSDDSRLFIKLKSQNTQNNDNINNVQIKSNMEQLYFLYNNKQAIYESIKVDNIVNYSDESNNLHESNLEQIHYWVDKNIKCDKNLVFFSIGNKEKDNYFFGNNKFSTESIFYQAFNSVTTSLETKYDTLIIDYYRIVKDKFIYDYRNLQFNFQLDLIDFLNYLSNSNSNYSFSESTIIITLKFFKYVNSNDISKTEREGSLILSTSFISLESFNSSYDGWNRFYSLVYSIHTLQADFFTDYTGVEIPLIYTIIRTSSLFIFDYCIDNLIPYSNFISIYYMLSKAKIMNFELFIIEIENYITVDSIIHENYYSKAEFHILEQIVSLIIIY